MEHNCFNVCNAATLFKKSCALQIHTLVNNFTCILQMLQAIYNVDYRVNMNFKSCSSKRSSNMHL